MAARYRYRAEDPTERELAVLQYASHGLTLRQAAKALGIAHSTAISHARMAQLRLGAKNLPNAVAEALRRGLIR